MGSNVTASYFNVDGTLVSTNLLHPTLYYLTRQRTPMRSFQKLVWAVANSPRMIVAELGDRRTFNEALFSAFEGMTSARLRLLADDAFETILERHVYPAAKDLVARSLEQGHEVVLVTGSLDFLMTRLAEHLGATHVIANKLEIKNGVATGRLLDPIVAGPEKARLIRDHAEAHGHSLAKCFAYSDSYYDVPMLSVVGNPAVVNPDRKLAQLANAHGWPILTFEKAKTARRLPWLS